MHASESPIFRGLTTTQIDALIRECTERKLAAGELLISRGTRGAEMYFLIAGKLRVFVTETDGDRELAELSPPAVVGEMEFLTGQQRVASVTAVEPATVLTLPFPRLRARIDAGDPACLRVMFNVATVIADRLDKAVRLLSEIEAPSHPRTQDLADFKRKLFSEWTF